ncbi:ABC transporter transmembrane domain-containing protein [Alphaproteobacteria bacterium]|nr:ABC transporter transmembrane domain-containing protein [Alphaproteobacteria bacterium]
MGYFNVSKNSVISRLINNYLLSHKITIFIALIMMIISAGATGLHAWLVQPALDEVLIKGNKDMLFLIPVAIILVTLCKGLATYTHSYQMSKVAHSVIAKLQSEMFEKLMYLNLTYFNDSKSGNLISRLINDTYYLRMAIVKSVTAVIKDILVIIFLLGNMFYQSWSLTLFAFFAFPLAIWPIKKIGKSIRKITYEIQNEIAKFSNVLSESIKGIRQVKAYNREEFEKKRAYNNIEYIKRNFIKSAFISNRLSPLMEFIGSLAVAVSIYAGGVFVLNETMTTGQFMSFLVSLLLAYQPVKALGNLNISVQEGLAGAERIFLLLDTSKNKSEKHIESKKINLDGNIEFNNINFSFEENNILKNINLTIESGKKTAFVGLSGSGKSTLINLLLRFYDDYSGDIKIDNHNIKSLSLFDLRENISLITQETLLFNESIVDNIRYGNMSSSDKKIEEIATLSGVNKFADKLPEKLHTVVGESGIKLSGGQRQRIAIARALIKNAPILVMDEATSSLDNMTEREIQKALDELMKYKTTIIIAHRLSTIKDADIIFTIDNGKIENKGDHDHLMENSAVYRKLQLQEKSNEN